MGELLLWAARLWFLIMLTASVLWLARQGFRGVPAPADAGTARGPRGSLAVGEGLVLGSVPAAGVVVGAPPGRRMRVLIEGCLQGYRLVPLHEAPVRLNGQTVPAAGAELTPGDVVTLGERRYVFGRREEP